MTVITFLTDFGLQDDFVGTCHGVIARIAPDARVIDLTHGIAAAGGAAGRARAAATRVPFTPVGVHLAVVDPGVGGDRRAVAVRTADGRVFVGPDNGLLMLAADELGVDGGARAHRSPAIACPRSRARSTRATSSRRRLRISPRACRSRSSARARRRRRSCASTCPIPRSGAAQVSATVLVVDRFGNVATNVRRAHVDALGREERRPGRDSARASTATTRSSRTRSPTRSPASSSCTRTRTGLMTLAISRGDAARLTGVVLGDELRIAADVTLAAALRAHSSRRSSFACAALWRLFRGRCHRTVRPARAGLGGAAGEPRTGSARSASRSLPCRPIRRARARRRHRAPAPLRGRPPSCWPSAEVVGVDVSAGMIAEARRLASSDRERYEVADASRAAVPRRIVRPRHAEQHDPVLRRARPGHRARRPRRDRVRPRAAERRSGCRSIGSRRELERRGFTHVATSRRRAEPGAPCRGRTIVPKLRRTETFATR